MSEDANLRIVQIVLRWAWDPIGVRGNEMAADEYDMYALHVLEMLEANAPEGQVADYLSGVVAERMELPAEPSRDADIAAMLRQLYGVSKH